MDGKKIAKRIGWAALAFAVFIAVMLFVVLPNLITDHKFAPESAAAARGRTVNTTQQIYAQTYPDRGFAPDLATLGPGPEEGDKAGSPSALHAYLIDDNLGNWKCKGTEWCTTDDFRYSLHGICSGGVCTDYVYTATPAKSKWQRSFCTTKDQKIRMFTGPPLAHPIKDPAECLKWWAL